MTRDSNGPIGELVPRLLLNQQHTIKNAGSSCAVEETVSRETDLFWWSKRGTLRSVLSFASAMMNILFLLPRFENQEAQNLLRIEKLGSQTALERSRETAAGVGEKQEESDDE